MATLQNFWVTADGKQFMTRAEAESYEAATVDREMFNAWYRTHHYTSRSVGREAITDIYYWLQRNKADLITLLNSM